LGISVNLFAALLYFTGAAIGNVLPVLLAAGYILLFEENEKLKRTAVKASILTVSFSVLTSLLSWLSSVLTSFFYMLENMLRVYTYYDAIDGKIYDSAKFQIADLFRILGYVMSSVSEVPYVCAILIMVVLGFRAYRQIDIKIKWIDKILDKHF